MKSIISLTVVFFRPDREKYIPEFLVNEDNIENISNLFNSNNDILCKVVPFLDLIMNIFSHEKEWLDVSLAD